MAGDKSTTGIDPDTVHQSVNGLVHILQECLGAVSQSVVPREAASHEQQDDSSFQSLSLGM